MALSLEYNFIDSIWTEIISFEVETEMPLIFLVIFRLKADLANDRTSHFGIYKNRNNQYNAFIKYKVLNMCYSNSNPKYAAESIFDHFHLTKSHGLLTGQ